MSLLDQPIAIGNKQAKNRIVMPPMVLFKDTQARWEPDSDHVGYYASRAASGTGTVIVEATAVVPEGRLARFQLRAWEDGHIPFLASVANGIKAHGALAMIQIHHAGANTGSEALEGLQPSAPSPVRSTRSGAEMPRELGSDEIERLVDAYASAAVRCKKAGFDGVELHGAHGYLLSQFISPAYNLRTDRWGGETITERMAFPLAVLKAVRRAVGKGFIVGYRLGAAEYFEGGLSLADGIEAARMLEGSGCIDLLNVSSGMGGGKWPEPPPDFGFSSLMHIGASVKKAVSLPVIAVGGVKTGAQAEAALEKGVSDMIAVGRGLLADPDWSSKALNARDDEIATCVDCRPCRWFRDGRLCARRRGASL